MVSSAQTAGNFLLQILHRINGHGASYKKKTAEERFLRAKAEACHMQSQAMDELLITESFGIGPVKLQDANNKLCNLLSLWIWLD